MHSHLFRLPRTHQPWRQTSSRASEALSPHEVDGFYSALFLGHIPILSLLPTRLRLPLTPSPQLRERPSFIRSYFDCLERNDYADLLILGDTKGSLDARLSVFHSVLTFSTTFVHPLLFQLPGMQQPYWNPFPISTLSRKCLSLKTWR